MTSHFKIIALALLLTGCSAFTDRLSDNDPLLIPPNVLDMMDDKPDQIICKSETPQMCAGFLTDKPIDIN